MFGKLSRILVVALLGSLLALPLWAQRGSANFTRYVSLGDSLTAGFESGSLVVDHQYWSYPAVMARQFGTPDFQQPLITSPGIPGEIELRSLIPLVLAPKSGFGTPANLFLERPYDNLGIPGARVADLLTQTGAQAGANPFYQVVLRGLGPAVGQAAALQPTFISVWIGNNEVLGAVTSGRAIEGVTLTPIANFTASYATLLDTLVTAAPSAGMVTATVPPVTEIPFATTLPPILIDQNQQPVLGPDNNPIFLIAELGDGTVGQLTPGAKVLLTAQSFLATGYGIPAALAPIIPLPNVGTPLPTAVVLDLGELTAIETRRQEINAAITSAANARNIPVLQTDPLFDAYADTVEVAGIELNMDFLTGGVMSFDGVHPTDLGYMLVANEFIKLINRSYGTSIPLASIYQFFSDNRFRSSGFMLPQWMKVDLMAAPWSTFTQPFSFMEPEDDGEPEESTTPSRRRSAGRGGQG